MNIYLAGRFSRRHELHALGKYLESWGHNIVSRWTHPESDHVKPAGKSGRAGPDERRRFALEDLEDIRACDCLLVMTSEPRNDGRGGLHVEYGYALAMNKKLIVIGPRETVFHELPGVAQFDTVQEYKAAATIRAR